MKQLSPEVSKWYKDAVNDTVFEVVAIDETSDTIEIQFIDGEVGEFDYGTWKSLILSPAAQGEDWRSPFEVPSEDEVGFDEAMVPENWSGPLNGLEPDLIDFGDDFSVL
ncbi:MAG: DUF6763 family protein [Pseudohongiellaceae bacterium]